jgi:glycerol kinase
MIEDDRMNTPVILAIDEGTTNAKAITVDQSGTIRTKGSQPLELHHPQPGWAEQDAQSIYDGVLAAIRQALDHRDHLKIKAIGISNQRESILIWDRQTGEAVTPVVNWQCRRSIDVCETIRATASEQEIMQRTGLPLDPLFPAAKLAKLLKEIPDGIARAEHAELCAGTVDTWLVWNLTAGKVFATDVSNASRTQLFNLHTQDWDDHLLTLFNVPRPCLPTIHPSCGIRGETLAVPGIPDGTPICAQIGDSHAALYGHGGFVPGAIKATYGTGSSLMTPLTAVKPNQRGIVNTVAWNDGELNLALEGNITHTGAGFQWISKILGINELGRLSDMAAELDSNQGVYFVPALAGLGAPYWDATARGVICGLTDTCEPATLARAGLEAIAYQIADVFYLMADISGSQLQSLYVDGGPTKNRWLMQFQADLLQREVVTNQNEEVSAIGAAYLAGKCSGWWKTRAEILQLARDTETIFPQQMTSQMVDNYNGWKNAVKKSLLHT